MKYTLAFILVLAVANADLLSPKFTQFMQLKEQAGNAVDAVMDVLNGLRQSALDERAALDAAHDETEAQFAQRIGDLTAIMNTNRGIYDATIANREFVEQEIVNTANYIDFIHNRFDAIDALVAELQDERCDASLVFVTRCREHYEALTAVDLLKQDLSDWEAAGMPVSLAQIKDMGSFNKLSAYTHLFKQQALSNFLSLAEGDDYMDERRATAEEIGDDHVDNERGAQVLEEHTSDRDDTETTVIGKLMVRLDEFVVHLKASMDDLIQAEIRAGRDTVAFIQESEKETHILQVELDRYTAYAAKLENDIVLAKDMEAKAEQTWKDSVAAVEQAKVELQEHRDFYMSEVDRLRNDVEVVDEVIAIFLQELQGIDDIIRNQQYDEVGVVDDERFSQGMFRNTDTDAGEYTGQANWEGAVDARF
jgi:hypothetical protein